MKEFWNFSPFDKLDSGWSIMTQLTTSDVSLVLVLSDSGDTGDGVIPTTSFKLQLALACLNRMFHSRCLC